MRTDLDLELVHVSKRYGAALAVDDISYHFKNGTYACLLGPSGCGKSSTLRMIAGHEAVSQGSVLLGRARCLSSAASETRHRDDVPELCAFSPFERERQCCLQSEV